MESPNLKQCLNCNKMLDSNGILKHIAKRKDCKNYYSNNENELTKLKDLSKARTAKQMDQINKSRSKESRTLENAKYYKENVAKFKDKSSKQYHKENHSISRFFKECQYGPIFPCVCCMRCLSLTGVKVLTDKFHSFLETCGLSSYIDLNGIKLLGNYYICHSCHQNLSKKNMPNLCHKNRLQLAEVPKCLQISSLANQLLAKSLIFYKFRPLKKTGMAKMNDRVISRYLIFFCVKYLS